jgi:ATP-dependent Clp protease, protease subunit
MSEAPPQKAPPLPQLIYATVAGPVDQALVQRIFTSFAIATHGGVKTVHSIFQTAGGMISDGVTLYNYFRAIPIDLHLYNTGSVFSIGVIAFLGAKHRYASANATFIIHKSSYNPQTPINAERASGMADALKIEDARTRSILESNLTIPSAQLEKHLATELPFDTNAALQCGLIHEIRDFYLPPGHTISNI